MKNKNLTIGVVMLLVFGGVTVIGCGNSTTNENQIIENKPSEEKATVLESPKGLITILESYLNLKNALASDNPESAAEYGKNMLSAFNEFDKKTLSKENLPKYNEIEESAYENAEHISENANKIDHQREHLLALSEDVNDLIELIGTDMKLYLDFCPMANNGKGATWISETKDIKNPYMGSKMPSCGKIKLEIN